MREGNAVTYLHTDHLGSTTLATDAQGAANLRQLYTPFGTLRYTQGTHCTDFGFTGQLVDYSTGLVWMQSRYYHPTLGRWLSPDGIVPHPDNPQEFNRYTWVINNPIRYVDPDGHQVQAAAGVLVLVGGTVTPLPDDIVTIPTGLMLIATDPMVQNLLVMANVYLPQISAIVSDAADVGKQIVRRAVDASNGATQPPNGSPNLPRDPFENAPEAVKKGVETLRKIIDNTETWTTGRYGAQAHLSRAEFYQQQGVLREVNPIGEGTIDLILNNNIGVEVKYWSAERILSSEGLDILANQFSRFQGLGLDQITVEFIQTQYNPVTQQILVNLQQELISRGVDLTNFSFVVVQNPGIP